METNKYYTSIEQAKILETILPHESADMRYVPILAQEHHLHGFNKYETGQYEVEAEKYNGRGIPCWSIIALLNVLDWPNDFHWNGSLLDACYEMILMLHKKNLI